MNMCNFLGISQDHGICDAFLRFQRWVTEREGDESRQGRQKVFRSRHVSSAPTLNLQG